LQGTIYLASRRLDVHVKRVLLVATLLLALGLMPLGNLVVGGTFERFRAPATVLGEGVICFVVAVAFGRALWRR